MILVAVSGYAQDTLNVQPPKIVAKMKLGQELQLEGTKILFAEVISDSRCPTGVNCVWPGEAKILLKMNNAETTVEKIIVIGAKTDSNGELICKNNNKSVFVHDLKPYPKNGEKINRRDYYLEIMIR